MIGNPYWSPFLLPAVRTKINKNIFHLLYLLGHLPLSRHQLTFSLLKKKAKPIACLTRLTPYQIFFFYLLGKKQRKHSESTWSFSSYGGTVHYATVQFLSLHFPSLSVPTKPVTNIQKLSETPQKPQTSLLQNL